MWQDKLLEKNLQVLGRRLTKAEFLELFREVFDLTVTAGSVKAGWRNCGIWPPDLDVAKLRRVATALVIPPKQPSKSLLLVLLFLFSESNC